MVELKKQQPYIDENGNIRQNLEKHWAEDENGNKYYIIQVETGIKYSEAVDVFPCRYTYKVTNEKIEVEEVNNNN